MKPIIKANNTVNQWLGGSRSTQQGGMQMEIDGLLLCSECENQLKVDVYNAEFGFYKVYPCKHCAAQPITEPDAKQRRLV